jgi:hypothetical protein
MNKPLLNEKFDINLLQNNNISNKYSPIRSDCIHEQLQQYGGRLEWGDNSIFNTALEVLIEKYKLTKLKKRYFESV